MPRTTGARSRTLDEKLWAVRAVGAGRTQAAVAHELGVHPSTVSRWCRRAREGGLNALVRRPMTGRPRKAPREALQALTAALRRPPRAHGLEARRWTLALAAEFFRARWGVRYHPSHLGRLLRRRGVRLD